ncbi:MAG: hypothetical protein HC836_50420 [Richelia sp. RM2_1_2]|nr:hypothetical protein [Richelia sp. RM2_1_2]
MSVSDEVMEEWIPLLTDIVFDKDTFPMKKKLLMAFDITKQLTDESKAFEALHWFNNTIRNKNTPDDLPNIKAFSLIEAIILMKNCSKTEAKRLISDGAVRVNLVKADKDCFVKFGEVIQIGKRHFAKIGV